MSKVSVLGAGSWGTALALVLADNHLNVLLWGHREELVKQINETHQNEKYLPGVSLPLNIKATTSMEEAILEAETVILAVPTKAMREVCKQMVPLLTKKILFVHVSKGIEPETHLRVSEMIEEEIPEHLREAVVVLTGPSHAEEVSLRQPTTVTAASYDMNAAKKVQDLFINQHFRVYTNADVVGVEIGGSLKNIIALAAGITDGLGYGDNAKAALITRGLAEIARLGAALGANPLTFLGLTGMGDLIVTCTSVHSRNWRAGNMLGKGKNLDEVLESMGMVVEGVRTTKATYQLAKKMDVNMPLTFALYEVLFNGVNPKDAVDRLMSRDKTSELDDLSQLLGNQ